MFDHYQYHNSMKKILSILMKMNEFEIYLIRNDVEEEPYVSSNINQRNKIKVKHMEFVFEMLVTTMKSLEF